MLETMASVNGRLEDIGLSRREKIIEVLHEAYEIPQDENKTQLLHNSAAVCCICLSNWWILGCHSVSTCTKLEKLGVDGYFTTFAAFLAEFPGVLLISLSLNGQKLVACIHSGYSQL